MISDTASACGLISTRSSLETPKEANKFICQVKQRNLNSKGSKLYFLSWHFLNLLINLTELKNLSKVMTCILYFWYLWHKDLNRTYPIPNTRWTTHIKTVFVTVFLCWLLIISLQGVSRLTHCQKPPLMRWQVRSTALIRQLVFLGNATTYM